MRTSATSGLKAARTIALRQSQSNMRPSAHSMRVRNGLWAFQSWMSVKSVA